MTLPSASEDELASLLLQADPLGLTASELACDAARQAMVLAQALGRHEDEVLAGVHLCGQLLRLGLHAEVLVAAQPLLQRLAQPPLDEALRVQRRELMRVFSMGACETGSFDRALDNAHELVRLVGPQGDAAASLMASFTLGICFERMGDSWQAQRVLGDALRVHGDAAPDASLLMMENALCAISIGLFHRLNGAAPEAEVQALLARAQQAGTRASQRLPSAPDPRQEVAICGNLGEVLLYQGQHQQALALLSRALANADERGFVAYHWRLRATYAVLLLKQGQAEEALSSMRALIETMGPGAPQQTAIRAHHAAYRACRALGRFEDALLHFEAVEGLERQRAMQQLRAQSELFVTRTEAQQAQWQATQAREDAQKQRARAAEFAASAERDPLTGLGNRRHFDRRCTELLPALQRDGEPMALVLLDIDHFKIINDTHGHAAGDRALVALAGLLRENTRSRDVLARYGGEEFVIVLPGMTPAQAREVCERLRERVATCTDFCAQVPELRMTVSLGLAVTSPWPDAPAFAIEALMQTADLALYRAKHAGRNRLCVAPQASAADQASVFAPDHDGR